MTQVTVSKEIKKVNAQMALTVLESYLRQVLEPHYQAKMDKLPERGKSLRTAGLWQSRIIKVRSALMDLRAELEAMPD